MTHSFYVYASYGFAALVTVAVTVWTWADGHARRTELAALEAAGIRRRSARPKDSVGDGE
ncbi:heme exporter protein CcmD [Rhizobium leguminosarum]|uniref:heme exporter protein CcmD n=1 Tax=Rhizobium leguminosarum TaxID=384 RepID=UPI0014416073|nr:heme exporter protein CcmD [Rhizobium leguminosarum]NKL76303.1 heme exporter protein CcmD [Rhizobium leguminosarum bv. viciae]MBY5817284.1 heme exporter protein CcmD [Rhizobium leguminosarum]MBY5837405.1 heme exporter protein CcmD [Rhizobium leguminosarum]MBY5866690.1 heme exporter protein CcmD [Rhizobium leguminosarum]NKM06999.1 heme exporter protein CcmD [Rhizobium leguminosarum bv. viciae]